MTVQEIKEKLERDIQFWSSINYELVDGLPLLTTYHLGKVTAAMQFALKEIKEQHK